MKSLNQVKSCHIWEGLAIMKQKMATLSLVVDYSSPTHFKNSQRDELCQGLDVVIRIDFRLISVSST